MNRKYLNTVILLFVVASSVLLGAITGRYLFQDYSPLAPVNPSAVTSKPVDVFLLVGQSNMEGAAPNDQADVCLDEVFLFGVDYRWYPVCGSYSQIGNRKSRYSRWVSPGGFGPARSFAREIMDRTNEAAAVGLILATRGGSNIGQWQKYSPEGELYREMIQRALASKTQGELRGLLFSG